MKFRILDKRENKAYSDKELLIDCGGEVHYLDLKEGLILHPNQDYFEIQMSCGLKDVNGVEIFEGDKVKILDYDNEDVGEVRFLRKDCAFIADLGISEDEGGFFFLSESDKLEVIR